MHVLLTELDEGIGSHEAGFTDGCETPPGSWVLETELWSFARTVSEFNLWALSPVPEEGSFIVYKRILFLSYKSKLL